MTLGIGALRSNRDQPKKKNVDRYTRETALKKAQEFLETLKTQGIKFEDLAEMNPEAYRLALIANQIVFSEDVNAKNKKVFKQQKTMVQFEEDLDKHFESMQFKKGKEFDLNQLLKKTKRKHKAPLNGFLQYYAFKLDESRKNINMVLTLNKSKEGKEENNPLKQ